VNNLICDRASQLFASLSHPTRLRIVELLCTGERTVNEIAAELHLGQSGTSQHLAILTRAGVLMVEQRGVSRFYRVRGPRIQRILDLIVEFCQTHELYGLPDDAASAAPLPASTPTADPNKGPE